MQQDRTESTESEITLDRSRRPRGRRGRLDLDAKEALLRLYASGEATTVIADRFGIDETYVRKLASRYGIRKGVATLQEVNPTKRNRRPAIGGHLPAYKKARRGFHLPERLEPHYIRLLVSGLNCREAARRLGVAGEAHDGR
jgi:hypothetical protein